MRSKWGGGVRRFWSWIAVAGVALVLACAVSWVFGGRMVRGERSAVAYAVPPAQDFTLKAADGITLAATYWPGRTERAPGVLLLHGNGASRATMADNARWLAAQGYAVFTVDFRGHGQSDLTSRSFGLHESRDAAAAFAWLKHRQQGARIGVVGVSLGGAASLLGEEGPLAADALVLQAVYPDIRHAVRNRIASIAGAMPAWAIEPWLSFQSLPRWGVWPGRISPVEAIRSYRGPVLVIGGGEDAYTPPAETRALCKAAPGPKAMWIVDGLDHAHVSALSNPEYRAKVGAFLSDRIGTP